MKKYRYFRMKDIGIKFVTVLLISLGLISSCKEDTSENTGEPYFTIEGDPTGLSVSTSAKTQSYGVRSNRPWQIVPQSQDTWVRAWPEEGKDDGIFQIIVSENTTFDPRTLKFSFVVDGKEQPVLFTVTQDKAIPYLTVADIAAGKNINSTAQDVKINVKANIAYTYSSDATWFTFKKADVGSTISTDLTFSAAANSATASRIANVSFV